MTALSLGVIGCGSNDDENVDDGNAVVADEAANVVLTNDSLVEQDGNNSSGNSDDLNDPDGIYELSNYQYIVIAKNVRSTASSDLFSSYQSNEGFGFKSNSIISCVGYGFFGENAETYDNGSGVVTTYISGDYIRQCSETDYYDYPALFGYDTLVAYYN